MQDKLYSLEAILASISTYKKPYAKKRLIFDQSPVGGIGSKWVISFFLLLPVLEYAGIFNPWMFNMLGIAQAIIFFIVFLSMVMIMVFALTFINNTKVIRQITPSWNHYFPGIEIKSVLASGETPYKDFFTHYSIALGEDLRDTELYTYLKQSFTKMQEENKDLLEAMQNARTR